MSHPKRILRRALLATTTAAAATSAHAATGMKPELSAADAKLVALAKEYAAQHAEFTRLDTVEGGAVRRMHEIEAEMVAIDAETPAGDRAKATVGLLKLGNGPYGPSNSDHDLVWSLLTNIVDRVG